jgi:hyperosmotically inducible periplasmic protein
MKAHIYPKTGTIALGFLLCLSASGPVFAQSTDPQTKPDNSKINQRDRNADEATADQQKMNPADRDLTARIRKDIMADKTLSTYAHNVKVISQDGMVTLKGPVRSDEEMRTILAKAAEAAGGKEKVNNEMSVKPGSKP